MLMTQELLEKLSVITDEERSILDGKNLKVQEVPSFSFSVDSGISLKHAVSYGIKFIVFALGPSAPPKIEGISNKVHLLSKYIFAS